MVDQLWHVQRSRHWSDPLRAAHDVWLDSEYLVSEDDPQRRNSRRRMRPPLYQRCIEQPTFPSTESGIVTVGGATNGARRMWTTIVARLYWTASSKVRTSTDRRSETKIHPCRLEQKRSWFHVRRRKGALTNMTDAVIWIRKSDHGWGPID